MTSKIKLKFLSLFKIISSILLIVFTLFNFSLKAEVIDNNNKLLKEWNNNNDLASFYLLQAEKDLKLGDKINACINQRKASEYGLTASNYLMRSFILNEKEEDILKLKKLIQEWDQLSKSCI